MTRMAYPVTAWLLLASTAAAQQELPPPLQPYSCTSPDGHWVLQVDPTCRDGGGAGRYRSVRDGIDIWSGEKPWTFHEALVTDQGIVAGYSYSTGGLRQLAKGEFHVVILGPDGSVLLDEAHPRTFSRVMHAPSDPRALGLFQQPSLQRVGFRIADPQLGSQLWWCFQLPTGREVYRKHLREDRPKLSENVLAVVPVEGTPLLLVEFLSQESRRPRLYCALFDAELQEVWDSGLYPESERRGDDRKLLLAVKGPQGTLVDERARGRFGVGLPAEQQLVHYVAERRGEGWTVREVGREPWSQPPGEPPGRAFAELPLAALQARGTCDLGGPPPEPPTVRDIRAFAFAAADVLRVVREDGPHTYSLLRVDAGGKVLDERHVAIGDDDASGRAAFWPLGPSSWLATIQPSGASTRTLVWRLDEPTGQATRLPDLPRLSVDAVAAFGDGSFAVLATRRGNSTASQVLLTCDAKGQTLRKVESGSNTKAPGDLFSPKAIAVSTTGQLAVLDVIRHTIQCFRADGSFVSTLRLDDAWGQKANYPIGLQADLDGGLLVHDFHGTPPLYRMDVDGGVRARVAPRLQDGRVDDNLSRSAQVAPDGRLWATDGQRLLRLDDHGVVDLQVGAKVDPEVLAEPWAATIDVFGRMLVQDKATGAVHVFDGHGHRLFVCRPEATDFENPSSIAHLAATRAAGVIAQAGRDGGYVRFGPDGARQGGLQVQGAGESLVFSPVADVAFGGRFAAGFVKFDADLQPLADFERAPGGRWLTGAAACRPAVAIDGAVAVVDAVPATIRPGNDTLSLVLFETADPAAGRVLALPALTPSHCLALGPTWAAVSGYRREVLLVHRRDGRCLRFVVPGADLDDHSFCFGFDPKTDELLALDARARKLHRFALP